jgi:hypothetical protein
MGRDTIIERRSDMSRYLIHWTTAKAFEAIIRSGFLIPGWATRSHDVGTSEEGKNPTIYGSRPAVCFSEIPIGNWIQSITAYGGYSDKRWGIAIQKRLLYAYGARPVLYISKETDLSWEACPVEEQFRLNNFHYTLRPDWSHEREWRVCANTEFNAKIGLSRKEFEHSGKTLSGDSLVPIHLPNFDLKKGELDTALPNNPHFVIIVETEKDKDKVRQSLSPAIHWNLRYSSISAYRDKYLEAR